MWYIIHNCFPFGCHDGIPPVVYVGLIMASVEQSHVKEGGLQTTTT